jgi:hypothetical protein
MKVTNNICPVSTPAPQNLNSYFCFSKKSNRCNLPDPCCVGWKFGK